MWYCLLNTVIYQDFVTSRKSNEHHWEGRASGNFTTSITRAGSWVRALSFSFVCSSRQKRIRLHRDKGKKADSLRPYLVNKTIWDFRKFARIWVTTREEDSVVTAGSIDQLKDVSRSVLRWRSFIFYTSLDELCYAHSASYLYTVTISSRVAWGPKSGHQSRGLNAKGIYRELDEKSSSRWRAPAQAGGSDEGAEWAN